MQRHIAWLWIAGFLASPIATEAQTRGTPSAAPVTKYDGSYAFVSSAKVNEIYYAWGSNRIGQCGDSSPPGPLTIVNGHARYNAQEGTVGPQGELSMRLEPTPFGKGGGNSGIEITTSGIIDANGTVRARRMGYNCRYNLIWQKMQSTPFPAPSDQFDGTYAFSSATNVNEWTPAHTRRCGYMQNAGPLVIVKGHARYTTASGYLVEGTVGSQGELSMRCPPDRELPGYVRPVIGRIDGNRTVRARQIGNWCSHDLTWQREPK